MDTYSIVCYNAGMVEKVGLFLGRHQSTVQHRR